ncbi:hypothetical protein [Oceanobacillus sp. FSL H7-0719]|uniref:hypothetical protein n=1 Tax=Oceanobacillus sp. FSL H7-0719 TaxID=2954507 RepID=UPI003244C6D7
MSNRIWTDEAIITLEKYYPIKTMKEMRKILPEYTPRQINRRAKYMGLRKREAVKIQSRLERSLEERDDLWTDEEKQIVIQFYETEGSKGVQKRIKEKFGKTRNIDHIIKIANRMGIKRDNVNERVWEIRSNKLYEVDGQLIFEIDLES